MDDALDLDRRDGLPDALRVLLHEHPRATWPGHDNFAGLVAFWLDRHLMFRKLGKTLRTDAEAAVDGRLDLPQMQARLSRYGAMLVQQLHGHHQIEDMHYFPVLGQRDPRLSRGFEILDRDHHAMDALLERFTGAANAVLQGRDEPGRFHAEVSGFETLLLRHLEDEEDLIVPVLLKYGTEGLA
ncbi:hemerythrin domain-containing protein [Pseudoponticoccus marisrubri]|uniref:Dihydrodipicolinate reductase n=1 Tax=Pseudoponticoccus marisrubri TaxID=1685382 RepID=A0A0W7WPN3_9RHOB|nr:hemerythrin domain-containing protein [Pseudoponticoccus marisrubri]KUF12562.1 dihydrodipicolinate reductase [Pseudoponticoccus marisrubri]